MENTTTTKVEEICIKTAQALVTNWSKSTAQRKIDLCRAALKKNSHAVVTVAEFKEYYEIN